MTTLSSLCSSRWAAGMAARRRSADEPFRGEPLAELAEEIADAVNYCDEALRQTSPRENRRHWLLMNLRDNLTDAYELLRAVRGNR